MKLAVPWTLGHMVVYWLASPSANGFVPAWLWAVTAASYVLPSSYVVSILVRRGRTPYDWAARTVVIKDAERSTVFELTPE